MNIGILTLPLRNYNYGGILQAHALSHFLTEKGHDITVLNRVFPGHSNLRKFLGYVKRSLLKFLLLKKVFVTRKPYRKTVILHEAFLNRYVRLSKPLQTTREIQDFVTHETFDAIIVGSDQVWRKYYTPDLYNYFLDFTAGMKLKRILFAASFGVDFWELSPEQTEVCRKLIRNFDFISVREDSAVDLCKKYFGVDARILPDPTFLFGKEYYQKIIEENATVRCSGDFFYYILDELPGKQSYIDEIAKRKSLIPFSSMPPQKYSDTGLKSSDIKDCIEPSIPQWLRSFYDARFVLTDSLHGCLFSIIFNRPFLVIGNENRGMARITSLLKTFSLEDRLISSSYDLQKVLNKQIDWESINKINSDKRSESIKFLESALTRTQVSASAGI